MVIVVKDSKRFLQSIRKVWDANAKGHALLASPVFILGQLSKS